MEGRRWKTFSPWQDPMAMKLPWFRSGKLAKRSHLKETAPSTRTSDGKGSLLQQLILSALPITNLNRPSTLIGSRGVQSRPHALPDPDHPAEPPILGEHRGLLPGQILPDLPGQRWDLDGPFRGSLVGPNAAHRAEVYRSPRNWQRAGPPHPSSGASLSRWIGSGKSTRPISPGAGCPTPAIPTSSFEAFATSW